MPEPTSGTNGMFIFPGTDEERDALLGAVGRACACAPESGSRRCGAHRLLLDERALKHLVFYRRCQPALWPDGASR